MRKDARHSPEKPHEDKELAVGAPMRVGRLDTFPRIRREGERLYREARRRTGRFPNAQEACRLSNILGQVRASLEYESLQRIEERLEQILKGQKNATLTEATGEED